MPLSRRAFLSLLAAVGASSALAEETPVEDDTPVVTITDQGFTPQIITIRAGQTLRWVNEGSFQHSAWDLNDLFDTGMLNPGQSVSLRFNRAATYTYRCRRHGHMRAHIIVTP